MVLGIVGNFDPEKSYKARNLLYSASQSYLSKEYSTKIEQGKYDKAKGALSLNYSLYQFEASDLLVEELVDLSKNGLSISLKNTPKEYIDEKGETLANDYFGLASKSPKTKLSKLLVYSKGDYDISRIVALLSSVQANISSAKDKRKALLRELNQVKGMNKQEKLLIAYLLGYSVSENNYRLVSTYLKKIGFSREEIIEFLSGKKVEKYFSTMFSMIFL